MFFRKKEEVFINPSKGKKKALPPVDKEELSKHFGAQPEDTEENPYPELPIFDDEPEEPVSGGKHKKEKVPKEKKPPSLKPPFWHSKLFIGTSCITVACLIAFVLVPVMSYVTSTEMTTIVRVQSAVKKGARIDAAMLRTETVPAMQVSGDALRIPEQAVGRYAAVDIVPGDMMLDSKLTDVMPFPDDYLHQLPDGMQAISATIPTFAAGLSGKLQAGDVVSVYAVLNQNDEEDGAYIAIQPPELSYVQVLAVTDKRSLDKQESAGPEQQPVDEESQPVTVTLLANPAQAAALAGLNINAQMHMSLVCRGDAPAAQGYLQLQQLYFEELTEPEEDLEEEPEITEPVDVAESEASSNE